MNCNIEQRSPLVTNAVENIPFSADKHLLFLTASFEMKRIFNKTIHEYKSEYYNKNKYQSVTHSFHFPTFKQI